MTGSLLNPTDSLERQNQKLLKMTASLMRRVEQATDDSGAAYAHFERALTLEDEVRARTQDLEETLELLNRSNASLSEANLAAERARTDLFNAIEAIEEGFALFDTEDRLVMCNSRFCEHVPDVVKALVPGLPFADYVRLISQSSHLVLPKGQTPQDWARMRMRTHRQQHVNFNVRIRGNQWSQVSEHRTPDRGTVILQTDVTDMIRLERQERERLLDDQAKLLRATLDHINQGICIFDSTHRLVGWNRRLGTLLNPPMHLIQVGRSFERLFNHLSRQLVFGPDQDPGAIRTWVSQTGHRPPLSLAVRLPDDMHLDIFAQEMPDRGFVISFTDVTTEREAITAISAANESLEKRVLDRTLALEDALGEAERANASKSRFVAAASHDLLQPLSAAKLFLSSLENTVADEQSTEIVRKTQTALVGIEDILSALLDISRLDLGRAAVEVSAFPLAQVLQPLKDEFAPLARQKGIELRVVDCDAQVESDPSYLRRVLQNLMANAVRYTTSGKVLVGVRRSGPILRLQVWDTGPGIPEDQRENIFKEFQRLDPHLATESGMGLGLAIVDRACALLGHPLNLFSEPGRGTGFSVSVPLAGAADINLADASSPDIVADDMAGLLAVFIENDDAVRIAMSTLLESWQIDVLDFRDVDEALETLKETGVTPDVMLVDYHLGADTDGLDAIASMQRLTGSVPAALITADRTPELLKKAAAAGIRHFSKPVPPDELMAFMLAIAGTIDTFLVEITADQGTKFQG